MTRIKGYGKSGKDKNGSYSRYGKEVKAKAEARAVKAEAQDSEEE